MGTLCFTLRLSSILFTRIVGQRSPKGEKYRYSIWRTLSVVSLIPPNPSKRPSIYPTCRQTEPSRGHPAASSPPGLVRRPKPLNPSPNSVPAPSKLPLSPPLGPVGVRQDLPRSKSVSS
ncbi:hypothetical protein LY76DRAFT_211346 [Colletotrichum caudatum]|nr:hypothetical protein LY76DRAFT_211346 [Colletotrichum caudatum]